MDKVTVPTLVVAHENDTCVPTPPDNAQRLKDTFVNSSDAELLTYTGGKSKEKGCSYVGSHSYYGIQEEVVNGIVGFIMRQVNK